MADWTQTVTNSLGLHGPGPTTKWGEFNWGEANWGSGTEDLVTTIGKYLSNTETLSDSLSKKTIKNLSDTIDVSEDMSSQELFDGDGYNYVFTLPTTEGENRSTVEWTESTDPSTTWTSATAGSTTWSEV
jgi:hypothetical protein